MLCFVCSNKNRNRIIAFKVTGFYFLTLWMDLISYSQLKTVITTPGGMFNVTLQQCEKKLFRMTPKDAECFEVKQAKPCNQCCLELARKRCGRRSKGQVTHYQCKNKQKGPKKACCCAFRCTSLQESEKEQKRIEHKTVKKEIDCDCAILFPSENKLENSFRVSSLNSHEAQTKKIHCKKEKDIENKFICEKKSKCAGDNKHVWKACILNLSERNKQNINKKKNSTSQNSQGGVSLKKGDPILLDGIGSLSYFNNTIALTSCGLMNCGKKKHKTCANFCEKEFKKYCLQARLGANSNAQINLTKLGNNKMCKCCCEPICLLPKQKQGEVSTKMPLLSSTETMESPDLGSYIDPFDPEFVYDGHLRR